MQRGALPSSRVDRPHQNDADTGRPLAISLLVTAAPPDTDDRSPGLTPEKTSARPFRVLGLQQVAIGGLRRDALEALWVDLLGVARSGEFRSERENVDEAILTLGTGPHAVEIDLMQPIDAQARPRVHEPALNHIGLWVDDLHAAVAWLEAQGVRFTPGGIRKGAAGHDVCFIHPKAAQPDGRSGEGVLIELVQAPGDVITSLGSVR